MTKSQFEILTHYIGMLQDGCSKEDAIGFIILSEYDREDMLWLVRHELSNSYDEGKRDGLDEAYDEIDSESGAGINYA